MNEIHHIYFLAFCKPIFKACILPCNCLPAVSIYHSNASQSQFFSMQSLGYILHPLSVDSTVLNLILLFFRHFHIPMQTVFPIEWKDSRSTTNKTRRRYPYSRKKSLVINHPLKPTEFLKQSHNWSKH